VTRVFDDAGRLHQVVDWSSHTTTFTYDADSNLAATAYANGVAGTATFDHADVMATTKDTIGTATVLSLSDQRDPVNDVTTEGTTTYGYDPVNRLTNFNSGHPSWEEVKQWVEQAAHGVRGQGEPATNVSKTGSPSAPQ